MLAALAASTSAATLPGCRIGDMPTEYRAVKDWDRSILDTYSRLATTYAPGDLRSTAYAGLNGGQSVRTLVIPDLRALAAAARSAGARLAVQSAYRSYTTQAYTFRSWVGAYGYAAALLVSARPGHSEHQLGTTIDFKSYGAAAPWYYGDWATTKSGAWLKSNAWKYGFVMSYPKGKTSLTCYGYEPWHYRYVGREKAAKVRASGLTLRGYLWRQQTTPPPSQPPSPTPTPSPTPAPTPSASASAAPSASPTPTPTPTASPSQDTSESASPDPVADPASTAAPSPSG
jgi:D-alanyl-D-alanine carboxypeptidase